MSKLAESRSKAASTVETKRLQPMITEFDKDGKIVSKPLVVEQESKAASVGVVPVQVNKAKEIAEFMFSHRV
jgi:hypothetical protein